MMFAFLHALKRTRLTPRRHAFIQSFNITSKPAKREIGVVESTFVMAFIFISVLGPAGWILTNSYETHRKHL